VKGKTPLLGSKIARLRIEKGFSQKEFSTMCQITSSYLSQIETGYRQAGYKLVHKMAKYLDTTYEDLVIVPLQDLILNKKDGNEKNLILLKSLSGIIDELKINGYFKESAE
jgi:transcriptional regulator with XRE-family HTH domain